MRAPLSGFTNTVARNAGHRGVVVARRAVKGTEVSEGGVPRRPTALGAE
jgi:hypothetical protein